MIINELNYDLKKPCADCPFMKSSKFHEGVCESLPDYMESINAGTFAHTCHKTDNREAVDGPQNHDGPTQHCLGALLMLMKTSNTSNTNAGRGLWQQAGILNALKSGKLSDDRFAELSKKSNNFKVFTLLELAAFYGAKLAKILRRQEKNVAKSGAE